MRSVQVLIRQTLNVHGFIKHVSAEMWTVVVRLTLLLFGFGGKGSHIVRNQAMMMDFSTETARYLRDTKTIHP